MHLPERTGAVDFATERKAFIEWALALGKNPRKGEGYAETTVKNRSYRIVRFYEWVFDRNGGYTSTLTHDYAEEYCRHLAFEDYSRNQQANHYKAIKCLTSGFATNVGETSGNPR